MNRKIYTGIGIVFVILFVGWKLKFLFIAPNIPFFLIQNNSSDTVLIEFEKEDSMDSVIYYGKSFSNDFCTSYILEYKEKIIKNHANYDINNFDYEMCKFLMSTDSIERRIFFDKHIKDSLTISGIFLEPYSKIVKNQDLDFTLNHEIEYGNISDLEVPISEYYNSDSSSYNKLFNNTITLYLYPKTSFIKHLKVGSDFPMANRIIVKRGCIEISEITKENYKKVMTKFNYKDAKGSFKLVVSD